MKVNSPQLGFNNNVRHKGRVFHIQTEDSGVKHPHIITHLFADGGRILKSTKTSYAEFLEDQELPKKVRALMQEQHKAMFIALRAGKFDHMIDGVAETAEAKAPAKAEQPADSAPRPPQPSLTSATEYVRDPAALADTMPTGGPAVNPPPAAAAAPAPAPAPPPAAAAEPPPTPEPEPRAVDMEPAPLSPKARLTPPPARQTQPPPPPASQPQQSNRRTAPPPPPAFRNMMGRPSSPDILARGIPPSRPATADPAASRPVAPPPSESLQPPPASRLKPPSAPSSSPGRAPEPRPAAAAAPRSPQQRPPLSTGLDLDLQALELASEQSNAPVYQQVRDLPPPPAAVFKGSLPESTAYRVTGSAKPPPMPRKPLIEERKPTPGASRYAPSRPASIFGNAKPQEGSSIFGEDLISEKSLDEVILSYLAEDLEGGTPKK